MAPAAEGPLTLARAARACRPRCWAASLEAMEAVEPQAAATIARQRAIRSPRSRCRRRTHWGSTSPSRCPCRGVNQRSALAAVGACRSWRSRRRRCRHGDPGTRRPGRRRSSHPRHKLAFRCKVQGVRGGQETGGCGAASMQEQSTGPGIGTVGCPASRRREMIGRNTSDETGRELNVYCTG